eukprot:scaffold6433_cov67-Phaeocystis_antarctica.AAC.5
MSDVCIADTNRLSYGFTTTLQALRPPPSLVERPHDSPQSLIPALFRPFYRPPPAHTGGVELDATVRCPVRCSGVRAYFAFDFRRGRAARPTFQKRGASTARRTACSRARSRRLHSSRTGGRSSGSAPQWAHGRRRSGARAG